MQEYLSLHDVQYKYELFITKDPVILPLKHHLLLPERYERNFLDSYGSCEQKLRTQRRCRNTCPYDVQYKYELYINKELVILPLKHNLLLPERYERNFLDSYGSCEQKLRTQQRRSQTNTYDAQYKIWSIKQET